MSTDKNEYINRLIIELGSSVAKLALQRTSIMRASPVRVNMQFPGDYSLSRTYPLWSYGHHCILEKRAELSCHHNRDNPENELRIELCAQLHDPDYPQHYRVNSRKDVIITITGDVVQDSEEIKACFWKWVSSKHAPGRIMNDYLLEVQKAVVSNFSGELPDGLSISHLKWILSGWVLASDRDSQPRKVFIADESGKQHPVSEILVVNKHESTMDHKESADLVLAIKRA